MQFLDRIKAIECRAGVVNLSLWRLCRLAGVDYSSVHRWRSGESSPNVCTLDKYLGSLEVKLSEIEDELRIALAVPSAAASSLQIAS